MNGAATLRLKLQPPAATPQQIDRQAIASMLAAAPAVKIVLFRASAGFGKSTAMRQYFQRQSESGRRVAWLSLDQADNDASRFLMGLSAAVRLLFADQEALGAAPPVLDADAADVALHVFERISTAEEEFSLFLDDVEALHNPAIFSLLRELMDHLPVGGQLVMGSRTLPNIPFGRRRARGELVEIGAQQLRFTLDEAADFLQRRRSLALSAEDVQSLHAKTEGWIAALWLASAALDGGQPRPGFIARFAGTDKSLSDYLAEDVLARQAPEVRQFLMRTSILRQFDAHLCRQLLPELDADRILRELISTELLLVPIGDAHGSYRYHSLFAEFLQSQLRANAQEDALQLHRRASAAFEDLGRPVPAIDHAIAGVDQPSVLRLLEAHAPHLLSQGRMRLLTRWFASVPEAMLADRPALQITRIWAVCFAKGPWEAMKLLEATELPGNTDARIAPHVRALRPTALAMMDRYEEAYDVGRGAMAYVPSPVPFADNLLANTMATIATVVDHEREARRLVETARVGQGSSTSPFNHMYSEADDGILDFRAGRLRQAIARFRIALSATNETDAHTRGNAFAGVPYAAAVYESGDLERAAHLMQIHLPLVRDIALPDHVIMGYVTMSRIAFSRGEVDQALELLSAFEYLGHQRQLSRVIATAKLERARVLLLQGHHRAAREELDRADNAEVWGRVQRLRYLANEVDSMELARLRWDIHAGNTRAALGRIPAILADAMAHERVLRVMKLRLFEAVALHRLGEPQSSFAAFGKTLAMTYPEGFLRIVIDEGGAVAALIADFHAHRLGSDQYHAEPMLGEYVGRLVDAGGFAPAPPHTAPQQGDPGLTRKEIRVLQLLADGYSNIAMAEKLFVSESTVRTHLRNINVKLDTRSRTQAVAAARRIGVVR